MFIIHTLQEFILIPPNQLSLPTAQAIHYEIDHRYPNRVLMDVGLVICRHSDVSIESISHGVCVAGQGGAHHHCKFRLIVFRPFVEEVCLGKIHRSTEEGIFVSIGFFEDIFIPAYWMLRPSIYEASCGLWIWTPDYGEGEDDEEENGEKDENGNKDASDKKATVSVKQEPGEADLATDENEENDGSAPEKKGGKEDGSENRYEMGIGSEIRFKVKSIHFARINNSAKGRQALVSTTDKPAWGDRQSSSKPDAASEEAGVPGRTVRKRSTSVGLDEEATLPPTMYIVASICEDGLGLTSWWDVGDGGEEDEEEVENGDGEEVEP